MIFEIIGFVVIRLAGYGWLWGLEDFQHFMREGRSVYQGKGNLVQIGILSTILAILFLLWRLA